MEIRRLIVEEGFLDGLELSFEPGLNVLIGSRGSGKTSILELLRFAFAVPGYTPRSSQESRTHALSVLGSGRVTVHGTVSGTDFVVTRSADEKNPRLLNIDANTRPIVLSQNEIEAVGLQADGRLRLVDGFRSKRGQATREEEAALALVRSLSAEIRDLSLEADRLGEQVKLISGLEEQLLEVKRDEALHAGTLSEATSERERLQELSISAAILSVRENVYERSAALLQQWRDRLLPASASAPALEDWPAEAGEEDLLLWAREVVSSTANTLREALLKLDQAVLQLTDAGVATRAEHVRFEDEARGLRTKLEQLSEGAGALARRASSLEQQHAQLTALREVLVERQRQLYELQTQRTAALDRVDSLRDERFRQRQEVATELSTRLGARIRVTARKFGTYSDYAAAIADALRGSGLHYNALSQILAEKLSPRELAEAVETDHVTQIADLAALAPDRAARLASHLRENGLDDILTANLEDSIELSLLDGSIYKLTEDLSTGQRCTVVLPILLSHEDRVLIVDQPEDHLDNAFIVETLIRSITGRDHNDQLIFATHNANIPVLGNAARVTLMRSDGHRGFVGASGTLHEPEVVESITNVMEGGREAFQLRAAFYNERLPK